MMLRRSGDLMMQQFVVGGLVAWWLGGLAAWRPGGLVGPGGAWWGLVGPGGAWWGLVGPGGAWWLVLNGPVLCKVSVKAAFTIKGSWG